MLRLIVIACLLALPAAAQTVAGRAHVIDADTLDIAVGPGETVRVRLHGIDAPEPDQTCQTELGPAWACGQWASGQVRERIEGRRLVCVQTDFDRKYNRMVAICTLDGADVGRALVRDGIAFAYRKYSWDYDLEEKTAAVNDAGLHAARVQSPEQFRRTRAVGRFPPGPDCKIKGNISSKGQRIYHLPGQRHYEETGIRPERGERWFCSEAEAAAAGWRRARR